MGSGRLGLPRQGGERGGLTADHGPREVEAFAAKQRQKHAVVRPGIASQFDEIRIVAVGRRGRDVEHHGRSIEFHLEPPSFEITCDQDDRVPIGPQWRQTAGEHPESGVGGIGYE